MNINLAKSEIIHFVGIGGIGMSGLALIMLGLGFKVQGSDKSLNKNVERLKKSRIKFFLGHSSTNIKKATILVISSAIKKNNIEIREAKKRNLPIYKRGDVLAHITSLKKKYCRFRIPRENYNHFFNSIYFCESKIRPNHN